MGFISAQLPNGSRCYLLLVDSGSFGDAEADHLHVAPMHGQVEGAAFGLVQVVDVFLHRVVKINS